MFRRIRVTPLPSGSPQSIQRTANTSRAEVGDMNVHHCCHNVTMATRDPPCIYLGEWPKLSFTAGILSILHYMLNGSLVDPRLRASNGDWFIWSISSIWFVWLVGPKIHPEEPDRPERPSNQTDEPLRVARAQEANRPPAHSSHFPNIAPKGSSQTVLPCAH